MAGLTPEHIRALMRGAVDYAGCFPPASLPLQLAIKNFERYRASEHAWMLGRFVAKPEHLDSIPRDFPIALVSDSDHDRAEVIEAKSVVRCNKPTYCEVDDLPAIANAGAYAKIRTGGVTPEAIPSVECIASFIRECARLRLPFKATAGLHHAARSLQPLTYEVDAPQAVMHGFLNVSLAACHAWFGYDPQPFLTAIDGKLTPDQIAEARQELFHSFGSCSFEEPVEELKQWL